MKEKLYTIPINDAVNANDECPMCYIERSIEQDLMDLVLGSGSSYMESDIREKTDEAGFCRTHFKKMYDYGNTLGNAWIMKTHMKKMMDEMWQAKALYTVTKNGPVAMLKRSTTPGANAFSAWVNKRNKKCYICNAFEENYDRYLMTFFEMYFKDSDFKEKVNSHKGFCLPHFGDMLNYATCHLSDKQQKEFSDTFFPLMEKSMQRLYKDVSWLIDKFDYRYKDADWGDSKEALQNCMQKLKGGYPADPVYKQQKRSTTPPSSTC